MKRDDRELGRGQTVEREAQRSATQPAPGKVTRTSKLPVEHGPSVQRKTRTGSSDAVASEVKSLWDHTMDPWMDAAYRGTAPPEASRDAVQAKGHVETSEPERVHRAAAAGVAGSGGALPYLEQIQKSFGTAHDLTGVRAHIGGDAAEASDAMGAEAYATGEDIAFRSQPDLHTAAHEAAHVVQQRAGVQLSGGVGQAGDAYEQQADAVADRVVAGQPAADLLGPEPQASAGPVGSLQRKVHADDGGAAASQEKSLWGWSMDPWMDAAIRGTPPPSKLHQPVQAQGTAGVQFQQEPEASERGDSPAARARAIHEAFHGSLFHEDEEAALAQIRGQSVASIRRIRSVYQERYGARLEDEFASYCDDAQTAEALALLWPALPVIDRLQRNTGLFDDNEEGMLDVLRTATRSELAEAAADPRLQGLLDELSDDQQYEARRLIWPERTYEHVLWRIERAHGVLSDDEDAVYSALLDLSPSERRALWDEREQRLSFLGESELALVRRMCVGEEGGVATEAAALDVRMEIATEGLGTDDDAVRLVVGRVASLAEEEARLRTALDTGVTAEGAPLSAAERAALEARLAEIGGVRETLLTSERGADGALSEQSFLGRLHDDVSAGEYGAFTEAMGADPYERMKQQLLDAVGVFDDDEEAIYRAFRDLRAPLTLPEGRTTADFSADELRQMQEQATRTLRERLRNDPELAPVWSALDEDELAVVDAHVAGDTYQVAIHELEDAYRGLDTDEARIVRIVAGMSAQDRARMLEEQPPIYTTLTGGGLDAAETELVTEVFRTGRVPTERALDVAMGGWGDGTDEQLLLDSLSTMPDEERRAYRLGYWLHKQGRTAEDLDGEAQQQALERFRTLHARLEAELDDEDLDAAMERLIGLPAPEDMLSPQGRRMAAEIMAHRHRERLAMSGGLTEAVTSTDETAEQAATIYDAHLQQLLQRGGDISMEDFAVLVGLDAQFRGRFDEYRASVELVSNIAGTVAATVAAIVIVILSEGTLAPAAAELISSSGGAALWAAIAGASTRVAASEAFGGDFHQTMSTEGARNAVVGAIEGAVAVASAALAARAARLMGLSERALGAEIARAALDSTETGLAVAGRGFARGSLEGAIEGFLSGAVGDLVMTATDAETWRRSVWETLGSLGMSLLRGGLFGATSGGLMSGTMQGAGAFVRMRGIRGPARRAAEQFDEAVASHGGSAESVPSQAVDEIMTGLPEARIDPSDPIPGIRSYIQRELQLGSGSLTVEPLGGGFSGAQVFRVQHEGELLGIFKIFRDRNEMLREVSSLRRLAEMELPTLEPVGIGALGRHGSAGVAFMRPAEGEFVVSALRRVGELTGDARASQLTALRRDVQRVARAMAELHDTAASGNLVTDAMKDSEIHWLRDRWTRIASETAEDGGTPAIPRDMAEDIEIRLDDLFDQFRDADVPATIVHGDAHGGNFSVAPDGHVDTIDVETMWRSVDPSGSGTAPQATDAGRFSEWLMTAGADHGLSAAETQELQQAFLDAYRVASQTAHDSGGAFDVALRFYQVNFDTIVLRAEIRQLGASFDPSRSSTLQRLLHHLGGNP